MEFSYFTWYLLAINAIGFVLYLINTLLYTYTESGQIDLPVTIIALLGGSLGIVLSILLFDRKAAKDNMMSRVFVICILIIQVILFLVFKGYHADHVTLAFWTYLAQHKILSYYLIAINVVTFLAYAADKIAAIRGEQRIRIVTLLGLAFVGGSIGALAAMYAFRHKIRKVYFSAGVPLILIMQVVLLFYVMNAGW